VMVFQTVDVYEAHGNSDQKIEFYGCHDLTLQQKIVNKPVIVHHSWPIHMTSPTCIFQDNPT
jgi:hypothetical protein